MRRSKPRVSHQRAFSSDPPSEHRLIGPCCSAWCPDYVAKRSAAGRDRASPIKPRFRPRYTQRRRRRRRRGGAHADGNVQAVLTVHSVAEMEALSAPLHSRRAGRRPTDTWISLSIAVCILISGPLPVSAGTCVCTVTRELLNRYVLEGSTVTLRGRMVSGVAGMHRKCEGSGGVASETSGIQGCC